MSLAAKQLSDGWNIGRLDRQAVHYAEDDIQKARALLRAAELPLTPVAAGASRGDRMCMPGVSEKIGSKRPNDDSVAVKSLGWGRGASCRGAELPAWPGAYTVLTVDAAKEVACDVILAVENLETFRWMERHRWLLETDQSVLVVFRGDVGRSAKDSASLLGARTEPVWWFGDFDPAGLGMGALMPRLDRVILPPEDWLKAACRRGRRGDLFSASVEQWGATLDRVGHPQLISAWALLKSWKLGLPQEWMQSKLDLAQGRSEAAFGGDNFAA